MSAKKKEDNKKLQKVKRDSTKLQKDIESLYENSPDKNLYDALAYLELVKKSIDKTD